MSNLRRVVAHLASFLQFFLLFGLLTGCQSGSEPGSEDLNGHSLTDRVIVIDGLGRELSFTSPPSRIVSIAPSATEILVAAGGLDRLVGVTNVDDYPPEIAGLPVFFRLTPGH